MGNVKGPFNGRWKQMDGTILGFLPDGASGSKRYQPAHYHGFEKKVTLYGRQYRAVVVHSTAHDARKTKKLTRLLADDLAELKKVKLQHEKIDYARLPDARAALSRMAPGRFHGLEGEVKEILRYGRGRPRADGSRSVNGLSYRLRLRMCFYPICNVTTLHFGMIIKTTLLLGSNGLQKDAPIHEPADYRE
jgi:hypothetical protein